MEKDFKRERSKNVSVMLILFSVVVVLTSYIVYREKEYKEITQNQYNKAFYDLVNYTENVETMLAKAMVTKSPVYSASNLADIWREANLAQSTISSIPVSVDSLENVNRFLNQVSDYSYTLSKLCTKGNSLTTEQMNNIQMLYDQAVKLQDELLILAGDMQSNSFNWDKLTYTGNKIFKENEENINIGYLDNVNNNLQEYSGLIYDGAFSDHVTQVKPLELDKNEISENEAKKLIAGYIDKDKIQNIQSNGLQEGTVPVYNFNVLVKDEKSNNANISLSITKNGGKLYYFISDRTVYETRLDVEEAKTMAKEYLNKIGYVDMESTYYMESNNVVIINFASTQNKVLMYPDLIKVKVALDNGEILGVEAKGYIYNHHERNIDVGINVEEAKNKISNNLNITNERLTVIPTDWKTEILCYEFKGNLDSKNFLVYINAITGEEEKIYIVIDDKKGILTI